MDEEEVKRIKDRLLVGPMVEVSKAALLWALQLLESLEADEYVYRAEEEAFYEHLSEAVKRKRRQ